MTSSTNNNYLPHLSDASHPTIHDKGNRLLSILFQLILSNELLILLPKLYIEVKMFPVNISLPLKIYTVGLYPKFYSIVK